MDAIGWVSLVLALIVQGAALVWGASKISSAVTALSASVAKLDSTVAHLDARVHDHETRVTVLERVQEIVGKSR